MGITNEIDLILGEQEKKDAQHKFDKELVKFSQDIGVVKKEFSSIPTPGHKIDPP